MKKIVVSLLFGCLFIMGSAFAQVNCASVITCQFPDPMFGGALQPAIAFEGQGGETWIGLDIYESPKCGDVPAQTIDTPLNLQPGPIIVFLRLDPPLPEGTQLGLDWQAHQCDPLDCVAYTMGQEPPPCPMGTVVDIQAIELQ